MPTAALFIWHNKPIMFLVPGISGRAWPCESVTSDGHVETCQLKTMERLAVNLIKRLQV